MAKSQSSCGGSAKLRNVDPLRNFSLFGVLSSLSLTLYRQAGREFASSRQRQTAIQRRTQENKEKKVFKIQFLSIRDNEDDDVDVDDGDQGIHPRLTWRIVSPSQAQQRLSKIGF